MTKAKGVTFTEASAQRIGEAVRAIEGTPLDLSPQAATRRRTSIFGPIAVTNGYAFDIPSYSAMRVASVNSKGICVVGLPSADNDQPGSILFTMAATIPVGASGYGYSSFNNMVLARVDVLGTSGDSYGTALGSGVLTKGNTGFVALGEGTIEEALGMWMRPFRGEYKGPVENIVTIHPVIGAPHTYNVTMLWVEVPDMVIELEPAVKQWEVLFTDWLGRDRTVGICKTTKDGGSWYGFIESSGMQYGLVGDFNYGPRLCPQGTASMNDVFGPIVGWLGMDFGYNKF